MVGAVQPPQEVSSSTTSGGGSSSRTTPPLEQILQFGRELGGEYGFQVTLLEEFPGFDKIFYLGESGSSRAFRGDLAVETTDEAFGSDSCRGAPPHASHSRLGDGECQAGDVIWTTLCGTDHCRGFRRATPAVTRVHRVVTLRRLRSGQAGPAGPRLQRSCLSRAGAETSTKPESIQVPRIRPAGIFPVWRGLFFDPASWDGSDLFMPAWARRDRCSWWKTSSRPSSGRRSGTWSSRRWISIEVDWPR